MPVDVRYEEWSGNNQEFCDWIVAFASHAIDGLEEVWLDTELAWSATTGYSAKYNGYFSIPNLVLDGTGQNAFTFGSGQWNHNTARLTGCAYARFRFKVTGNNKKAESPFSSGIPSRITAIGRGAKLYDPRRDSTVVGGSGPMRWNDQSTWRFTTDDGIVIGENLPLQILRVILGWRIKNPSNGVMKLATGAGVPGRRISFQSFQTAANLADELVNRAAGGNEPRYHGASVISEGDDQKTVLDMLCSACCGRFRDTGGKLALAISHNDLAAAAVDDGLNDDDVVGAFTWDPDPSLESTPNVVRGRYVDATSASLYQLIDYPEVRLPSPDGQDRILTLDLGVVESPSHAQRVAKQVLQRRQYSRQFAAPFDIRAWKYTVGDVLPFTFAPLGFRRGVFRVKEQELGQNGTCNMVLTFETPAFYQWDADDSLPVQGAEPIVYDSTNNPLILAIDDAATTAFWNGVTGDGKPADNATNSADPNSPFGSGTVSQFETEVAAAKAQLAYIDGEIVTINKAVADADDRIDAADKDAKDALASAVDILNDKDAKLSERIDSVEADGGYDDTSVRAEIKRVDDAAVTRDGTIARQIDSVITDFKAGDTAANSRIDQVATTASDAKSAVGSLSTSVDTRFTGVNTTLTNYNGRLTTLSTDLQGYASRTGTLETTVGPADGSKQPLMSRVTTAENAIANFPGSYAAASRAAALEAQVNGEADSRLLGRANDQATVIADAKVGAVAQSLSTLSARIRQGSPNLLVNSDFHDGRNYYGTSGPGWSVQKGYYPGTFLQKDGTEHAYMWQDVSVQGNVSYSISANFGNDQPDRVFLYIQWFDANYNYLGNGPDIRNRGGGWTREKSVNLVAPSNAAIGRLIIDTNDNVGGTGRVNNLQMQEGPATDYQPDQSLGVISASITQQAGALAGIDGRTSVYWSVTGTTADGSTKIELLKSDGSAGLFYIGANLLVDGNAIFNGTVTIRALDRSTMTATTAGSVSGTYGGAGNPSLIYIPNLGADMAIRSGGSLYFTFTGNIAATTDSSGSVYASFEVLNAADNSVLASVRLPTPGFGPSGRLDNFVIRILNVWGELTIRWRVASRTTDRTWSIVQNPQCSVYWTAL
ncbi:phage tail protein [Sphingomonas sp. PAMC 26621]|uniref:phage tail protein n=1 Tax=Sphingomonas sp. PAMC 26621 TaxID=1112213 RepID=UPI0002ED05A9|nr:phage tail protein [Sphingomonas sp. PAMC 26621]